MNPIAYTTLLPTIFLMGSTITLAGCSRHLDIPRIEAQIKSEITEKGKLTVKSVICPSKVEVETGKEFECTGLLDPDGGFFVNVKQKDSYGNITTEVINSWRMLNLTTLEDEFQQVLQSAKIDCGGFYRQIKQGDSFNCKSVGDGKAQQTILVKIEKEGRITWQEVKEAEPLATSPMPVPTTNQPTPANIRTATISPAPIQSTTSPSGTVQPSPKGAAAASPLPTAPSKTTNNRSSPSNQEDWKELGD